MRICFAPLGVALALNMALAALLQPACRAAATFELRLPGRASYRVADDAVPAGAALAAVPAAPADLVRAERLDQRVPPTYFGPRLVLQAHSPQALEDLAASRGLRRLRVLSPGCGIFQAESALHALRLASALADDPRVLTCRPVVWRNLRLHGPNVLPLNDPRFSAAWHLENRSPDGSKAGPELAAREAWTWSRGQGVVVAVADDGIELEHPEFTDALANPFHFGFTSGTPLAGPASSADFHATLVAGFIAAKDNNARGISGLAPAAQLASWKIFLGDTLPLTDDQLASVFEHELQAVAVQNHSWGNGGSELLGPTAIESLALSNAVTHGRGGLGVVMVRSGGNGRQSLLDANDDGYANHPWVITVGGINATGRVASFSNPGACLLVTAPGGGTDRPLISTDRLGAEGLNRRVTSDDSADYVSSASLSGTSFSAPQISGPVALLLSANPALSLRDVRLILALAARPTDPDDPDRHTNGIGLVVSHNTGFGMPDANQALHLARHWPPLPPPSTVHYTASPGRFIPDDGLRVFLSGQGLPLPTPLFHATPGMGPHPDDPGPFLPLVDLGVATNDIAEDLTGKGAVILRGPPGSFADNRNTFRRKIERAAAAGAAFVILCNNADATNRLIMGDVDYVPIPAVMVDQVSGEALRGYVGADPTLRGRLQLFGVTTEFAVGESLRLETVQLRVSTSHARRGDLRIVLRSPAGTRSVMQAQNADSFPGPVDWTYSSTHHLGESSAGRWRVEIGDEAPGNTGAVTELELILTGVPLVDTDHDGLDDAWEQRFFGSLAWGPRDDPDGDGLDNAHEALAGGDPGGLDEPFQAWMSVWSAEQARLSWRARPGHLYTLLAAPAITGPFATLTNVAAALPETEIFLPRAAAAQFFQVQELP